MVYVNNRKAIVKSGITLVELVATLAILIIVLAMAFSVNSFGSTSYKKDDAKSDIQTNLRIASDYISKEMRYCSNVTILDNAPATFDSTKNYIYVNSDKVLMLCKGGVHQKLPVTVSNKVKADLLFEKRDYETLYFKIPGQQGEEKYTIDSIVKLLNICDKVIYGPLQGKAICYTPGKDLLDKRNTKAVKSIEISGAKHDMLFNEELILSAKVLPVDAPNKTIGWLVDDDSVATIEKIEPYGARLKATSTMPAVVKVYAVAMDDSGKISQPYVVNLNGQTYKIVFNTGSVRQGRSVSINFTTEPTAKAIKEITWEKISGPATIVSGVNSRTIEIEAPKFTKGQQVKLRVTFKINNIFYDEELVVNITP